MTNLNPLPEYLYNTKTFSNALFVRRLSTTEYGMDYARRPEFIFIFPIFPEDSGVLGTIKKSH